MKYYKFWKLPQYITNCHIELVDVFLRLSLLQDLIQMKLAIISLVRLKFILFLEHWILLSTKKKINRYNDPLVRTHTISPVLNIVFYWLVFLDLDSGEVRTDGRTTCVKIMITTSSDYGAAEWIKNHIFHTDFFWLYGLFFWIIIIYIRS